MRLKELEELRAQTKANANLKAKMAEAEGRLMCTQCQTSMYPNAEGQYEFERFKPGSLIERRPQETPVGKKVNTKDPFGSVLLRF
jgi:hypothetical protein